MKVPKKPNKMMRVWDNCLYYFENIIDKIKNPRLYQIFLFLSAVIIIAMIATLNDKSALEVEPDTEVLDSVSAHKGKPKTAPLHVPMRPPITSRLTTTKEALRKDSSGTKGIHAPIGISKRQTKIDTPRLSRRNLIPLRPHLRDSIKH
ncbi:MAG: hypothetical protein IJ925_04820 [Muribaculaceae bacterium]|nr:hypothetical protein [Muribaculaceae bacterium]